MASSISLTKISSTRHRLSLASISPSRRLSLLPPTPRRRSSVTFRRRAPAVSMSVQAPERVPAASSFLDHKESGVLHFVKYHGVGNDFIMVDNRDSLEPRLTSEQAVKLCDRHFGVGADGVIFVMPGVNGTDYSMRIFNSDGSEPEMCGNGIRCFARYIAELENLHGTHSFTVHTGAGLIVPEILIDGKVKADMGEPILSAPDIPTKIPANKDGAVVQAELVVDGVAWNVTCVSMGNPHCVTFGTQHEALQVDNLKLGDIGPKFENNEVFPSRTNTEFVQVLSRSHLKMSVWERGAEAPPYSPFNLDNNISIFPLISSIVEHRLRSYKIKSASGVTLACGTGACAVVVAAVLEGRSDRTCTVDLPGGPLEIEWRAEDNHLYMTGPAEAVFYGSVPL